jgi:hypothetical protein
VNEEQEEARRLQLHDADAAARRARVWTMPLQPLGAESATMHKDNKDENKDAAGGADGPFAVVVQPPEDSDNELASLASVRCTLTYTKA